MENNAIVARDVGTPQGGSISILLSNVYMHYVLDFEKVVRPKLRGACRLVRYIDDFVVFFQYQDDARRFYRALPQRLEKFELALEMPKTRMMRFGRYSRSENNESGTKQEVLKFLGFTMFSKRGKTGKFTIALHTQGERQCRFLQRVKEQMRKLMHFPVSEQVAAISAMLRRHFNYFGISGNSVALCQVRVQVIRYWRKCLSRRSQNGMVVWSRLNRMLERCPLPMASVRIRDSDFDAYARL